MSIDILLNAMVKEVGYFEKVRVFHENHRVNLKNVFDQQRERYRTVKEAKESLDRAIYPYNAPNFMTNKIQSELARESVRTNDQFNLTDGLDFFHAVVSISYCTHVVFDKKWACRCRNVQLPEKAAAIFDGTQMDHLLESLSLAI